MLKQPHVEKYFPLFHAIICHFLMNDTGRSGFEEKNDKVRHGGRKAQKMQFCE